MSKDNWPFKLDFFYFVGILQVSNSEISGIGETFIHAWLLTIMFDRIRLMFVFRIDFWTR